MISPAASFPQIGARDKSRSNGLGEDQSASRGDVHRYQGIACPFCTRAELGREFLSLEPPTRPARVVVRV
jgi:hypothetical protein